MAAAGARDEAAGRGARVRAVRDGRRAPAAAARPRAARLRKTGRLRRQSRLGAALPGGGGIRVRPGAPRVGVARPRAQIPRPGSRPPPRRAHPPTLREGSGMHRAARRSPRDPRALARGRAHRSIAPALLERDGLPPAAVRGAIRPARPSRDAPRGLARLRSARRSLRPPRPRAPAGGCAASRSEDRRPDPAHAVGRQAMARGALVRARRGPPLAGLLPHPALRTRRSRGRARRRRRLARRARPTRLRGLRVRNELAPRARGRFRRGLAAAARRVRRGRERQHGTDAYRRRRWTSRSSRSTVRRACRCGRRKVREASCSSTRTACRRRPSTRPPPTARECSAR